MHVQSSKQVRASCAKSSPSIKSHDRSLYQREGCPAAGYCDRLGAEDSLTGQLGRDQVRKKASRTETYKPQDSRGREQASRVAELAHDLHAG